MTIGGVTIYSNVEGSYMKMRSDCDVCTDGTGDHHGDKTPLDQTAYNPYLNADVDQYIVIPPQVRTAKDPVVLGCQAKMTRISTGQIEPAVVGEVGPSNKTGEAAYCLARTLNPSLNANKGDSHKDYLYEWWPGVPATVHGKKYKLQPA